MLNLVVAFQDKFFHPNLLAIYKRSSRIMKLKTLYISISLICSLLFLAACEEEETNIGSVIAVGEVDIHIDTIPYTLQASPVRIDRFDSKTGNLMIGSIQYDNYGSLDCSFITKLMCAAKLPIPDSIFNLEDFPQRVDSVKLIMGAKRAGIIGDSVAPQKLTVYRLNKELPSSLDIDNNFNPEGYYDPSDYFTSSRSFTVSGIAESDSAFYNNNYVDISVNLKKEFGQKIFSEYKENPSIFEWPQTMAKEFLPGLFVKNTFGNGCIANINTVYIGVFYYTYESKTSTDEDGNTTTTVSHVSNLAVPFTVSPEVLSSNNISYVPSDNIVEKNNNAASDGEVVITTPGGYLASFNFPIEDIIMRFKENNSHLSKINDLYLDIPAESFDENEDLGVADNLLLIKSSEYEKFFETNQVPDNKTSFTGVYDSVNKRYLFSSMRNYFLDMVNKEDITSEDTSFMLVPVEIETETSNNYYSESTYVTKCLPLTSKPTMTLLKSNEANVVFSFSTQLID